MRVPFTGVGTALITPFTSDGSLIMLAVYVPGGVGDFFRSVFPG